MIAAPKLRSRIFRETVRTLSFGPMIITLSTSGSSFLLPAFAAAFLGGTTLQPGRFNPWGAIMAAYFLQTGITGFQLLGVESYVQQLFYGGALVIAVAVSQIARRRQAHESGQTG